MILRLIKKRRTSHERQRLNFEAISRLNHEQAKNSHFQILASEDFKSYPVVSFSQTNLEERIRTYFEDTTLPNLSIKRSSIMLRCCSLNEA